MKRLLIVLALAALLASLGLSHVTASPKVKADKILVCHIGEVGFETDPATGEETAVVASAHVIEVSTNAESAHTGHGDVVITDGSYAKGDDCTDAEGLDAQAKLDSESDEDDTE